VLSVSAISPAWAVRSPAAGDGNVFKRPSVDPQNPSRSAGASRDRGAAQGSTQGQDAPRGSARVGQGKLKPADARVVEELSARDRQVRAHEAAHQAAAGSLGGAATFSYETGPDGKAYAVGGEVPVDMSGGRTPEETAARAAQIRAAALAPADPSPQDLAVAAEATVMEAAARQQIASEQQVAMRPSPANGRIATSVRPAQHEVEIPLPGQKAAGANRAGEAGVAAARTSSSATRTTTATDVTDRAAAATAAVEAGRGSTGPSSAQLQQLARLATLAYRG